MKLIVTSLAIVATALCAEPEIPGFEPQPTDPVERAAKFEGYRQIRVEIMIVRTTEAIAVALLPELRDSDRVKAAQDKLITLMEKKDAELVDWPVVTTGSGNRCVVENIQELRYPIKFSQPQVEQNAPLAPPTATPTPFAPKPAKAKAMKEAAQKGASTIAAAKGVPELFETRNLGVTLEIEPVIGLDGRTIQMQLAPQHLTFRRWNKNSTEVLSGKIRHQVIVEQPEFQTTKVTTSLSLASGQPFLLHFAKLQEPAGQVELFILTTTIVDERGREINSPVADEGKQGK